MSIVKILAVLSVCFANVISLKAIAEEATPHPELHLSVMTNDPAYQAYARDLQQSANAKVPPTSIVLPAALTSKRVIEAPKDSEKPAPNNTTSAFVFSSIAPESTRVDEATRKSNIEKLRQEAVGSNQQ